jgi:hypothetical protein
MSSIREIIQTVRRTKPKPIVYYRRRPVTYVRPSPAQAEIRYLFAQAVSEAKLLTAEQIAKMIGGEVVELNGKKYIKMPDGRILMKHMAYVKYLLEGYKSEKSGVKTPVWLEEISRKTFTPIPFEIIKRIVEEKRI